MVAVVLFLIAMTLAALLTAELFIVCMPGSLQRASGQNAYRLDGTLSKRRQSSELKAISKLRLDLWGVLAWLVFASTSLHALVELTFMPVSLAFINILDTKSVSSQRAIDDFAIQSQSDRSAKVVVNHADRQAAAVQIARNTPVLVVGMALWFVASMFFLGHGAMKSYRDFAKGVRRRADQYFHVDMSRMAIVGEEFAVGLAKEFLATTAEKKE